MLSDIGIGDVQKFVIWGLWSIGGNVDEVEISTLSTTQWPAHSDIHSSTHIIEEVNTGEIDSRGNWGNEGIPNVEQTIVRMWP